MKPFTIRKSTNPASNRHHQSQMNYAPADSLMKNVMTHQPDPSHRHHKSLLSQEEMDALKPKEVKVDNPWIYE